MTEQHTAAILQFPLRHKVARALVETSLDEIEAAEDMLRYFNKWRRDGEGPMPDVRLLGRAIDTATAVMRMVMSLRGEG
jgi:hypothetical protein